MMMTMMIIMMVIAVVDVAAGVDVHWLFATFGSQLLCGHVPPDRIRTV